MHIRARISALILAAAIAAAADAPTDAEWTPVAQALEAGNGDAIAQIEALTARYPKWPDGFRALALAQLRANDGKAAWAAARKALGLDPKDAAAGALGVQALTHQGRNPEAVKVAALFTDATDPGGRVAEMGAVAALAGHDDAALAGFIASAKARAGGTASPVLDVLESKQALARKDVAGAVAALERAVAARPDYHDALYELGRVRTVAALQSPDQAETLLAKSDEALVAAARLDRRDADARLALGRARLERAKRIAAAGRADEADAMLRSAIDPLNEALQLRPGDRDAKLWKGDVMLRLRRYDEAAPLLRQAYNAGVLDRALPFNLALALTKTGKSDEAAKILENINAASADEQLTLGISLYHQENWAAADKMLRDALTGLDPEIPAQARNRLCAMRYVAHCERELAALATDPDVQSRHLETALNIYKEAGDADDYASRHWYIQTAAARSPLDAFKAGQQSLKWDGVVNLTAWRLMAANYGYKLTHGEGFPGLIKYGPAHAMLWGLIAFIFLGLFAKGFLMPAKAPKPAKEQPRKPGTTTVRAPVKAAKPPTATTRKPGSSVAKPPPKLTTPAPKQPTPPPIGGPKTPFGG